jgi:uncharacterized protein
MAGAVLTWFKSHLPTRESIAGNRWLRPFAHHLLKPDLWRFNRRSVPRAVALGLSVGVIIPLAHTGVAAILAVPTRANIVIAAGVTWLISNPATWIPLYATANRIGDALLGTQSGNSLKALKSAWALGWNQWFGVLQSEGKSLAIGILVLATALASLGYLISSLFWRLEVGRRWRARRGK